MSDLKVNLKKQISELNLNTQSFADLCGIPVSSVKNILLGKVASPRYDTLKAIADALDTTPESLISGEKIVQQSDQYNLIANISDDICIQRVSIAFELLSDALKAINANITKELFVSLLDEVYEYIRLSEKNGEAASSAKSFVEWIINQKVN